MRPHCLLHTGELPTSLSKPSGLERKPSRGWGEGWRSGERIAAGHGLCSGLDTQRPSEAGEIEGGPYCDTVRNYWVAFCVQDLRPLCLCFPKGLWHPSILFFLFPGMWCEQFSFATHPCICLTSQTDHRLKPKREEVNGNKPFHFQFIPVMVLKWLS